MSGELGVLLLGIALVAAGVQAAAGLLPRALQATHQRLAHTALGWQALGSWGALLALAWAFATHDFSLAYVAQHSHSRLPLAYCIAATWGGHEGSMLLWVSLLALWSLAGAWQLRHCEQRWSTRVLGMLGGVSVAMLAFVLLSSNPFTRLLPAADEGRSLNPLLQDPGLVLHPPLLYLGYVGTALPFAMTLAALAFGAPADWVRRLRPLVLLALGTLSLGIALGSWWAYYELGWGGWWFWDPVENASLMPWLALLALAHALVLRDVRGGLPQASAALALGSFVLALLGTFLVRSGVLVSVHAFAVDPRRGSFILGLISAALLPSFWLMARHAQRLNPPRSGTGQALLSRDTWLRTGPLLWSVACACVLLGTLYPLALDALAGTKLSVGAPYFETVMAPLLLLSAALLLPAAWLRWGSDTWAGLRRRLGPSAAVLALGAPAVLGALYLSWGRVQWLSALALWLALGVAASSLHWAGLRAYHLGWRRFGAGPLGMVLAHLGVAVFMAGVAMVKGYGVERDVRLAPGERTPLAGCQLYFVGLGTRSGANYQAVAGEFTLECPGQAPRRLVAEKRAYLGSKLFMTESAISWNLSRDVYVALGEPLQAHNPQTPWSLRVQHKPFMRWVWLGVVLMAAGAFCAAFNRRERHGARA
jgi:cytochrome c-type biogenesis protein CcmF